LELLDVTFSNNWQLFEFEIQFYKFDVLFVFFKEYLVFKSIK